jgi:hypothetical protein
MVQLTRVERVYEHVVSYPPLLTGVEHVYESYPPLLTRVEHVYEHVGEDFEVGHTACALCDPEVERRYHSRGGGAHGNSLLRRKLSTQLPTL